MVSHKEPDNPKEVHIIRLAVALERTKELPTPGAGPPAVQDQVGAISCSHGPFPA
jgi:hypothetical protein